MSVLDELEQAVREVAERVGPSVVGIGRGRGRGSGVVLADGLVATNAHNIRGEETTVVLTAAPWAGWPGSTSTPTWP
jgi:S1-C subfamily serine protease